MESIHAWQAEGYISTPHQNQYSLPLFVSSQKDNFSEYKLHLLPEERLEKYYKICLLFYK